MMKDKAHPYVPPVPVKDIQSLSSDTITKKSHEKILGQISERFDYVFRTLMEAQGRSVQWHAFANLADGEGETGEFDPDEYEEEIEFTGQFQTPKGCLYDYWLPTRWISEDFEEDLKKELAAHKKKLSAQKKSAQEKARELAQTKAALVASIRSKLTKEELSCINFK